MKNFNIKSLAALILTVLVLIGVYGVGEIYAIAKTIEFNANVFSAKTYRELGGIECNEKMQNKAKKAVKTILDSGINTKVSEFCGKDDTIVCYTKNIYIELSTNSMQPVYMIYECTPDSPKISADNCQKTVTQFVFRNMPRKLKAKDAKVSCDNIENNIARYSVSFVNGSVKVAIRMDTGSVVYYDASENF